MCWTWYASNVGLESINLPSHRILFRVCVVFHDVLSLDSTQSILAENTHFLLCVYSLRLCAASYGRYACRQIIKTWRRHGRRELWVIIVVRIQTTTGWRYYSTINRTEVIAFLAIRVNNLYTVCSASFFGCHSLQGAKLKRYKLASAWIWYMCI